MLQTKYLSYRSCGFGDVQAFLYVFMENQVTMGWHQTMV